MVLLKQWWWWICSTSWVLVIHNRARWKMWQSNHWWQKPGGNPFATLHSQHIANIANAQLDVESNIILLQCLKIGETAYSHCNKYWQQGKTAKLFETVSKAGAVKRYLTSFPIFDTMKETASFMWYIDYSRTRNYVIKNLLHYELKITSFLLHKIFSKAKKVIHCLKKGAHNLFQLLPTSRWWLLTSGVRHAKSHPRK